MSWSSPRWEDCKKCPEKVCTNKIVDLRDEICYLYVGKYVHIHPPCWANEAKDCKGFCAEEEKHINKHLFAKSSSSLTSCINHIINNFKGLPLESTLALLKLQQEIKNDKQKRNK